MPKITYRFYNQDDASQKIEIPLEFDDKFCLVLPEGFSPPEWARLANHKCEHCPLNEEDVPFCPIASGIAPIIPLFDPYYSYNKSVVEVVFARRTLVAKDAIQYGVSSLMGLISATSGCPHTAFLRPLARFHLPFASIEETVFRVFSAWLLAEYVRTDGKELISLEPLKEHYANVSVVNEHISFRLRDIVSKDVAVNAVVILDSLAQIAPLNLDTGFDDIIGIFEV